MVAVTAAAMALDSFYGTIKPILNQPKTKKKAARARQILEGLKLGFVVGKYQRTWQEDLDWLFKTRNGIVHHAMRDGTAVILRITDETVMTGAPDTFGLLPTSAQRAAGIAETILDTCAANPKPFIKGWIDWNINGEGPGVKQATVTSERMRLI